MGETEYDWTKFQKKSKLGSFKTSVSIVTSISQFLAEINWYLDYCFLKFYGL